MKNILKAFIQLILITILVSGGTVYAEQYILDLKPLEQNIGAFRVLTVGQGGTGASTFATGECLVGNGTGAITTQDCGAGTGGGSVWSTSTEGLYTNNTGNVFVVGNTATGTDDTLFEIWGNVAFGTIASGTWQGDSIGDSYIDDDITASNYLSLTDWYATTTDGLTEGSTNLYSQWTTSGSDIYYNGGNVGIGTTTPSGIFELASSATGDSYFLVGDNGDIVLPSTGQIGIGVSNPDVPFETGVSGAQFQFQGNSYTIDSTNGDLFFKTSFEGKNFYVKNSSDNIVLLVDHDDGKLGIQDTSPDAMLEIAQTGSEEYLMLSSAAANDGDIMIVDASGNVGIGTSVPAYALDVNGDINTSGYYYGQPLDGQLGSGIIWAEEFDTNGNLELTHDGGDFSYPDFTARIIATDNVAYYCDVTGATSTPIDDSNLVYYVDNTCAVSTTTVSNYATIAVSPGGFADIATIVKHSGDIEIHMGAPLQNKVAIKARKSAFFNTNLDIISGFGFTQNTFPSFTIANGVYNYIDTVVNTTEQVTATDYIEYIYHTGGEWAYATTTGLLIAKCDNGTDLIDCTNVNKYRRRFIFVGGFSNGDDETELHLRIGSETISYTTLADCLNTTANPITYDLPDLYDYSLVPIYAYCGRPSATGWLPNQLIDLRDAGSSGSGASVDTSVFLTKDGTRALTGNWAVGSYSITGINNLTSTNFINSGTATTTNLTVTTNSKLGTIVAGTWNGAAIDISDYTNLTAGDYLTLTDDDLDVDAELSLGGWEFVISSSTMSTSTNVLSAQSPYPLTISEVSGYCENGTTTITLDERLETTPKTSGTDIFNTGVAFGDYVSTTTFANASIAEDAWVSIDVDGTFIGAPTDCYIRIKGNIVD